jgi:hypothetical protein
MNKERNKETKQSTNQGNLYHLDNNKKSTNAITPENNWGEYIHTHSSRKQLLF